MARAVVPAIPALSWPIKGAFVFGGWTLIGLFGLAESVFIGIVNHAPLPLHAGAVLESVWLWAAFTPAIYALAERYPIERRAWLGPLGAHFAFSLLFAAADVTVDTALAPWVDPTSPADASLLGPFSRQLFINVYSYFAVLAVGHAVRFYRLYHQRHIETVRLEGELLRARLTALEMRLRPHFLYNTLNSIAALVRVQRGSEAISMIAGLGDLLRDVLDTDGAIEVPLRRELAFVERYLAIEQIRFGDRLRVRVKADPSALDAMVPTLLLQPIVENAVRHGIESSPSAGAIEIDARRDLDALCVSVRDDGEGAGGSLGPDGIGLGTTRERLRQMFGDACSVSLSSGVHGNVTTTVRLPFRAGAQN